VHDPRRGRAHRTGVLIAECGLDMSQWPTVGHFASWAGICPGNRQSAGRQRSGHTRPGPHWLREALTESAKAAARTKNTYLAAHHAQLRGRRGEAKATGATRHDILVAYYHIVRDQVPFRELGPDWQHKRYCPSTALGPTTSARGTWLQRRHRTAPGGRTDRLSQTNTNPSRSTASARLAQMSLPKRHGCRGDSQVRLARHAGNADSQLAAVLMIT